jgi:hypothetical protein
VSFRQDTPIVVVRKALLAMAVLAAFAVAGSAAFSAWRRLSAWLPWQAGTCELSTIQ